MAQKHYKGSMDDYKKKLARVMERVGASGYDYDCGFKGAWIEFQINGRPFHFEDSIIKSQAREIKYSHSSDCFASLVLTLEDLSRASEKGYFSFFDIIKNIPSLQAPIPECFRLLGFTQVPDDPQMIKTKFAGLAKQTHPDRGGSPEEFAVLLEAKRQAEEIVEGKI